MDSRDILWANSSMHQDLITMFKKAFPGGVFIEYSGDRPCLCANGHYTFNLIGVFDLLTEYSRPLSA